MIKVTLLKQLLSFILIANIVFAAEEGWIANFEEAKKKATAENKDLFLEFTGSDWCPPCKELSKNVFSKPEFVKSASEKFILVKLDFPKEQQLTDEETAHNEMLAKRYGIQGFPTVVLCDSSGVPYGVAGFQPGGPAEYMEMLEAKIPNKKKLQESIAAASKLEGKEKADAIMAAIKELENVPLSLGFEPIFQLMKEADPTSLEKGLVGLFYIDTEIGKLQPGDDFKPFLKKLDDCIEQGGFTNEEKQYHLTRKLDILYTMSDFNGMRTAIDEIIAIAPESELGKNLVAAKPRIDEAEKNHKQNKSDTQEEKK